MGSNKQQRRQAQAGQKHPSKAQLYVVPKQERNPTAGPAAQTATPHERDGNNGHSRGLAAKSSRHGLHTDADGITWERVGHEEVVRIPASEKPSVRRFDLTNTGIKLVSVPYGTVFHLPGGQTWVREKAQKDDSKKLDALIQLLSTLKGDRTVAISGKQTVVLRTPPHHQ